MPIYKKGPGSYLVRLYRAGKPKSWVIHGTRKEAESFEASRLLELEAIGPTEYRTAPGFSTFCLGRYRVYAEAHLKAGTWRNRQYQIATLIEFFGQKPIDRITSSDVERFQHERLKLVSPVKVNDDTKVLRAILRYAIQQGIPARCPDFKALPERKTKGRVKVWTTAEVEAIYRALDKTPARRRLIPMLATMLNAGLRKGEVLALEWSAVDLNAGALLIYPNEEWQPKNGEPREVPIGRVLRGILESLPRDSKRWVFPVSRRQKGAQEPGRYAQWPQNTFDAAIRDAGVGGSPHVARHTYASHFLSSRPDLFLLAQVMGHSHTRVTELYSHLLPEHLERARDAVSLGPPLLLTAGDGPETVSVGKRRERGGSGSSGRRKRSKG